MTPEERMAKNEALFREVNERIRDVSEPFTAFDAAALLQFVCECGRAGCTQPISLTLAEYEQVRAHPARFALALGHEAPEVEAVVETTERFSVVEKHPEAAAAAVEEDPRRR